MNINYKEAPEPSAKTFQTELDDTVAADKVDPVPPKKRGKTAKDRRQKEVDQSIPQSIKEFLKSDPMSQQKVLEDLQGKNTQSDPIVEDTR